MRYHAHYHTRGLGHVYQQRFKSFSIQSDEHFLVVCRYVETNALRAGLVDRVVQGRLESLWRWLQRPEPLPKILSPRPMARLRSWTQQVNEALSDKRFNPFAVVRIEGKPTEMKAGQQQSLVD